MSELTTGSMPDPAPDPTPDPAPDPTPDPAAAGARATTAVAIVPCNDLDAAELWWNRLGFSDRAAPKFPDYRRLEDGSGGEVHLGRAPAGWVVPGRNPFGVYVRTPRVDALAAAMRDAIIEPGKAAEHKAWGMYEFSLDGPDDLLVRIGWPSCLLDTRSGS